MAVGDNIPGIFGDIVSLTMKSGGEPQYLIDVLEDRDADTEQALRNEIAMGGGPPMPMGGSLFEQNLFATGNPMQAAGNVINEAMAPTSDLGGAQDQRRANLAAQQMWNMTPGMLPERGIVNEIASGMDISPDALVTAFNTFDLDTALSEPTMGSTGENLVNPIPERLLPSVPPRSYSGAFPDTRGEGMPPSPMAPPVDMGETKTYQRSERMFPFMPGGSTPFYEDIFMPPGAVPQPDYAGLGGIGRSITEAIGLTPRPEERLDPYRHVVTPPRNLFGIPLTQGSGYNRDLLTGGALGAPQYGPIQREQPLTEYQTALTGIQSDWGQGSFTVEELENQLRSAVISGLPPQSQIRYEAGDDIIRNSVNQTVIDLQAGLPPPGAAIEEATEDELAQQLGESLQAAETVAATPDILAGAMQPAGVDVTLPAAQGGVSDPSLHALRTMTPSSQWSTWLPSQVPNYYSPYMASSYETAFNPFLGSYLLTQGTKPGMVGTMGIDDEPFTDYMIRNQPHTGAGPDWEQLQPSWNNLLDYAEAGGGFNKEAQEILQGNFKLWQGVTGTPTEQRQLGLSTALARYHEGQPVRSNYASRAVENTLNTMYDRVASKAISTGKDPLAEFLTLISTSNPQRFGR